MTDPIAALASELGLDPPSAEVRAKLLDLARTVAHSTERKNAPLATYLAGMHVARAGGGPTNTLDAFAAAVDRMLATQEPSG